MGVLQMSIQAGVLIIAIMIIRKLALNKIPNNTFLALWGIALVRLIVPFFVSSQFSIFTIINRAIAGKAGNAMPAITGTTSLLQSNANRENGVLDAAAKQISKRAFSVEPLMLVWLAGILVTFIFFILVFWKNYSTLRFSIIIRDNSVIDEWLSNHKIMRSIKVFQSDRVATPISIGYVKPRIILPKAIDMEDEQLLRYVLTHEYYHIRRFDAVIKLVMTFAVCVHWFNPMVWVMVMLVNRDLEITCDEMVVRHFGGDSKITYAYTLIGMAEQQRKFEPFYSGFSKNAAEERIRAIMKLKKTSFAAIAAALIVVLGVTTVFATTGKNVETISQNTKASAPAEPPAQLLKKYAPLINMRFDGYENLTITEYRDKAHAIIGKDEAAYHTLIDNRIEDITAYSDSCFLNGQEVHQDITFIEEIFIPTIAEKWQTWDFGGSKEILIGNDKGRIEYSAAYTILNPDTLKMGERNNAIAEVKRAVSSFFEGKSDKDLLNELVMQTLLESESKKWEQAYTRNDFKIKFNFVLYRVDQHSEQPAQEKHLTFEEIAKREGKEAATPEEFELLLSLRPEGYKKMSVADFNEKMLIIMPEDSLYPQSAFENVRFSLMYGFYPDTLTEEDLSFLNITLFASIEENWQKFGQKYTDEILRPGFSKEIIIERNSVASGDNKKNADFMLRAEYTLFYTLKDSKNLTVGERDNAISDIINGANDFIKNKSDDELAASKEAFEAEMHRLAKKYSDKRIQFDADKLFYEILDERALEALNI